LIHFYKRFPFNFAIILTTDVKIPGIFPTIPVVW